ncbi:MAG: SufB/SufD family protein, partial [Persicimonas sp.]
MAVTQRKESSERFKGAVLSGAPASGSPAIERLRKGARERLEALELPGKKDEEWRFLRLRPLTGTDFVGAESIEAEVSQSMVDDYAAPEADGRRLVFVNGAFRPELSDTSAAESVQVGHIADPDLPEQVAARLGKATAYYEDDYFLNLNAAGLTDGAYIVVPDQTEVSAPFQVLHISTESTEPFVTHPRNVVVVGQGSTATLVEHFVGPHSGVYFNNVVNEIAVGEEGTLHHTRIQDESRAAFHFERRGIDLAHSASYDSQTISLGARLSRFDVYANGDDEEIDCTLDGLAVLSDKQVSDTHSVMDHRKPHAGSHQLHKMILDDASHAVFNGKIFVQPHAQIIDAYQLNRTLLLSDRARVNAKPQLEIFA